MAKTIKSQTDIKIKVPEKFSESYDKTYDIRYYGNDNLYPNHLRNFYESSPTFNSCAKRLQMFLLGAGSKSTIIDNKVLEALVADYSIFGGFALHVAYNGLGDIASVTYVPFESIRLGEQGSNGLYTYCYYSPDWTFSTTINKKKVQKSDRAKFWIYTTDVETRLRRMNDPEYSGGEILYYSNSISYPTERVRAVINYVSAEIGIQNLLYRDVRCNFMPATALAIPRQSDDDMDELAENIQNLQGDESSFKILTLSFSSSDDKPEALNLSGVDYMDRILKASDQSKNSIIRAYNQESFIRLEDGSLGFGSEAIGEIFTYYNFFLQTERKSIDEALKLIDPTFALERIKYEAIQ